MDFSKLKVNLVRKSWDALHGLPGGRQIFSRTVGEVAPYTGTISAEVEDLRDGYARVSLRPRRRLTNHLNSVHAIALLNLGEMATGLAVMYNMPASMRGIPVHLGMDYVKKSRGKITAETTIEPVIEGETYQKELIAELRDASGDVVARFRAVWQLSPKAS